MIKISALDFLNIDKADVDIRDRKGNIILAKDSPITQQLLLKYYFKDLYIDNIISLVAPITVDTNSTVVNKTDATNLDKKTSIAENVSDKKTTENTTNDVSDTSNSEDTNETNISIKSSIDGSENTSNSETATKPAKEYTPKSEKIKEPEVIIQLKYDENVAKEIEENAVKVAKLFGFNVREIEDIKKAAHYCNISLDNFTTADLKRKDFGKRKAQLSYDMTKDKVGFSEMIKDCILTHENPYDSALFALAKKIPYAHIVAVASNYYTLRQLYHGDKEKTLKRMLEYGGNKFNIFVLHKFIRLMRESND